MSMLDELIQRRREMGLSLMRSPAAPNPLPPPLPQVSASRVGPDIQPVPMMQPMQVQQPDNANSWAAPLGQQLGGLAVQRLLRPKMAAKIPGAVLKMSMLYSCIL